MVKREKPEFVTRFVGTVESVELETSQNPEISGLQYHIVMKPEDENLLKSSKSGAYHEWCRVSLKARDDSIPEGSVLDRYLAEVELILPEAREAKTHQQAMKVLVGKKIEFAKKKLGKSFSGHEAKEYWCPVSLKE